MHSALVFLLKSEPVLFRSLLMALVYERRRTPMESFMVVKASLRVEAITWRPNTSRGFTCRPTLVENFARINLQLVHTDQQMKMIRHYALCQNNYLHLFGDQDEKFSDGRQMLHQIVVKIIGNFETAVKPSPGVQALLLKI